MREKLKAAYYFFQKLLRKDAKLLKRIQQENLLVVLNLHQVSPHQNPFWSPLKPEIFEDFLVNLKENFEVVLFRELAEIKSDKPLAVLSFDDGYYNFIEYALPLLEKHKLRANMNIIPLCVESDEPMWNIKLYDFLNSAPKNLIDEICLPGFDFPLKDESFGSKVQYGLKISRFLKNRSLTEREILWQEVENVIRKSDFQLTRMMNRKDVLAISKEHEIGVHSFSHESMEFESTEFFREDLRKCRDYFVARLKMPLEIYAFPNGSYRTEQIEILQDSGVKQILLVGEDYAKAEGNIFPRFTIYGSSTLETRFQSLGFNRKF